MIVYFQLQLAWVGGYVRLFNNRLSMLGKSFNFMRLCEAARKNN
jgi:hypothetical protein